MKGNPHPVYRFPSHPPEYRARALQIANRGGYTVKETHAHLLDEGKKVSVHTVKFWLRGKSQPGGAV